MVLGRETADCSNTTDDSAAVSPRATEIGTLNRGFIPTARVLALQSMTAPCSTRKSAPKMQSTVRFWTTVNFCSARNSPRDTGTETCPTTSRGMPLAARVFCVSVLAMELRQQSANTAYRTTDTAAPESSRNFAEVWPMCPPTRSMVFTWGPECNTCGWRFSTVLASCPPSELTPRSLKGNVFGYAPPVCIASKLLGAGFDPADW